MISNPIRCFVSGNDAVSFTYEGGRHLYHFSPYDNGLSGSMEHNLVFFADNEKHALDVLKRMVEFVIEMERRYVKNIKDDPMSERYHNDKRIQNFKMYLTALNAGKIKLTKAPTNQFFQVGWACNDTV